MTALAGTPPAADPLRLQALAEAMGRTPISRVDYTGGYGTFRFTAGGELFNPYVFPGQALDVLVWLMPRLSASDTELLWRHLSLDRGRTTAELRGFIVRLAETYAANSFEGDQI